jgi:hypothetical protein
MENTTTTNNSEHPAKDEEVKRVPTYMAFNKLCADGIFRPVHIAPMCVTSVVRLTPPSQAGNPSAHTVIHIKEPDTFAGQGAAYALPVYEEFQEVLAALGTAIAAQMISTSNFFYAGKEFEENGIKYLPEVETPEHASDSQSRQTSSGDTLSE